MLWKLLVSMLALFITAAIIPGIGLSGIGAGFLAALILGIVNSVVKPIFTILTLPLTILTLGLFLFVLNGLMLMLAAAFVPGFTVSGIFSAIFGSIVLGLLTGWTHKAL
ncbi:MAG: phage holin family protein [Halanaerobiales bacterium]